METIAIIHEPKPRTVSGVIDTEMSREDLLRIIIRQHDKMQRMQEDYESVMEMNRLLERQNQRLLREKLELLEDKLCQRSFVLVLK